MRHQQRVQPHLTCGQQLAVVGRHTPCDRGDLACVPLQNTNDHARLRVPYGHRLVFRCGRQQAAVEVVRDTVDIALVMLELKTAQIKVLTDGPKYKRSEGRAAVKFDTC